TIQGATFNLSLVLIAVIWILVAVLMLWLENAFENVTGAARYYVNLRGMNLRALERLAGVGQFGPALLEHALVREFLPLDASQEYRPYAAISELASCSDLSMPAYSQFGGFTYLRRIIKIWRVVFQIVL